MTDDQHDHEQHDSRAPRRSSATTSQLLKPRVMSLVVFTALVGLLVAPGGVHPMVGFAAILFIASGRGRVGRAEHVVGRRYRRHHEAHARRPVPAGKVDPGEALAIGLALSVMSVAMLGLATNWLAAGCWPSRSSSTP
jgi:protoheme IX farnesyltransferase